MKIECPHCGAHGEEDRILAASSPFHWTCPNCVRTWDVRTVFFQASEALLTRDWPEVLRWLRKKEGLTQVQLGELVGLSGPYISVLEAGKRTPSRDICRRILEALGAHEEASKL